MSDAAEICRGAADPCPNCGDAGARRYCPACGQDQRHDLRRPLRRLAGELADEALSLDGKLLRTLPALVLRPGRVAADLFAGRRARHTSALRLFLGASVAFFFAAAVGPDRGDAHVVELSGNGLVVLPGDGDVQDDEPLTEADLRGQGRIGAFLADHLARVRSLPAGEAARRFMDGFAQNAPRALFVMVPLLALLLKAAYPRRFYAEHLILALHAQAIGFLALAPGALSGWTSLALAGVAGWAAWTFLALRHLQGEGRLRTALKLAGISAAYALALGVVLLGVVVVVALAI